MDATRGCRLTVLLIAVAILGADGVWIPSLLRPECNPCWQPPHTNCGEPVEGKWLVQHYYPMPPDGALKYSAKSEITFLHMHETAYFGVGKMTTFDENFIFRKSVPVELAAQYNYETCSFKGAIFNFGHTIQHVFDWKFDAASTSFLGTAIIASNTTILHPVTSKDSAILLKRKPKMPFPPFPFPKTET